MQRASRLLALLLRQTPPLRVARLARRDAARSSRNSMADRPQDFCGRHRSAVRPVQHLNLPFDPASIGDAVQQVIGKAKVSFPC